MRWKWLVDGRACVAVLTAISLGSCVPPRNVAINSDGAAAARTNVAYRLSAWDNPSATYASPTVSLALDRIDQRTLPLDGTYRHSGTGRGVTVYVFDGGVSEIHPELAGRVRRGYTEFPNDPKICNSHGTAVAGAIAGTTLGVAPEADIVDIKMVTCSRLLGTFNAVVNGTRWVIADHKLHGGPAVANWSFIADTGADIPAMDSAVAALRAAGIPVIVSAGNIDADACHISPASAAGALVVGSSSVERETVGKDTSLVDRRTPGSAWGRCIDLYAPGDSVLLPSLGIGLRPIEGLWKGTSFSAGYVSGAVALYLEAHPQATPDEVAAALRAAATESVIWDARAPVTRLLYVGKQ